jgi:hypothetical protein
MNENEKKNEVECAYSAVIFDWKGTLEPKSSHISKSDRLRKSLHPLILTLTTYGWEGDLIGIYEETMKQQPNVSRCKLIDVTLNKIPFVSENKLLFETLKSLYFTSLSQSLRLFSFSFFFLFLFLFFFFFFFSYFFLSSQLTSSSPFCRITCSL